MSVARTSAARPRFAASGINLAFDGNSLVYGVGSTAGNTLPQQVAARFPVSQAGVLIANVGASGQSTQAMIDNATDIDGAWVSGKNNILLVWEGTNSVCNVGRTGLQAATDMANYIAARKAVHPWTVVLLTTIPRAGMSTEAIMIAQNTELAAYDTYLRANFKSMGAAALVDVRQSGSPFITATYTSAAMTTLQSSGLWSDQIHLNNAGYAVIAGYVAAVLARLRSR